MTMCPWVVHTHKMAASLRKLYSKQMPLPAGIIGRAQGSRPSQLGPWRSLSSGRQWFNAASLGLQARIKIFPLLFASGGGYMGYDQYCRYKDRELTKTGIEVSPRIANATQIFRHTVPRERTMVAKGGFTKYFGSDKEQLRDHCQKI